MRPPDGVGIYPAPHRAQRGGSSAPDEFGHDLCATAVEKTDAGVVFLVKAAAAEQLLTPMSEQGVLLVCKPFSNTLFLQAIHMAAASNHRLQVLRQENARMQEKLQQQKQKT